MWEGIVFFMPAISAALGISGASSALLCPGGRRNVVCQQICSRCSLSNLFLLGLEVESVLNRQQEVTWLGIGIGDGTPGSGDGIFHVGETM